MTTARFLVIGGLLALGCLACPAETNAAPATGPAQSGPVVMPPPDKSPPPPSTDLPTSISTNSVPAVAPSALPGTPASAQPGPDEIYDIRPPLFFLRSWLWLWLILAAISLAGLVLLLWRWFSSRRAPDAKTAYELTLEKLEQARSLMDEEEPRPYANAVSEVIRTYLGQRFHARSTLRTTEEFLREMETGMTAPLAEHRDLLRNFLQACDLLKFARYRPGRTELEQVQTTAVKFVTATKPVPTPGAPLQSRELIPNAV